MHISKFIIRNFRNFESADFNFKEGVNTIIGENGSGKTNFFYALRLMLDDTLPRYIGFGERDFNRNLGNWQGHWIILTTHFSELDLSEESQALSIHACGQVDTEEEKAKGSYILCFRPKSHIRQELYEYSQKEDKDKNGLENILSQINITDYETVYLCRGYLNFSKDDIYKSYVGDFENIIFPNPNEQQKQKYGDYLPREINLYNEISCTFIKALRDVASDLRSYSNNPLVRLLKGKGKSIEIETQTQNDLVDSINELNSSIASLNEVIDVQKGIDDSLKQAVGTTYAPNIEIRAELPNKMDKLLQSLRLWVGDSDDEDRGQIAELSLGGANLIFLSLKLLEYEKIKTDKVANVLLIEEPEAHIHTHIQKTLFDNLHQHNTQIFVSTHSTQISSVSKISSVNILSCENKKSVVFNPSYDLDNNEVVRIERYLDAVRSDLLFAKGVLLIEGDAEQILIPVIFKKVFGLSLDEIGISLINIGSTGFKNIARIFHQDRVNRRCGIITDFDESFISLPINKDDDNPEQKKARNSQKSGIERKANLELFCENNMCIKPFFAKNTFEVDMLLESNAYEFKNVVHEIYKTDSKIEESKSNLDSEDVEVSGREVLKLATTKKKGWFALLVAEEVNVKTGVPDYILSAIAWSSPHINSASKVKAARYRLENVYFTAELLKEDIGVIEMYSNFKSIDSDEDLLIQFRDCFQNDPLTKLLNHYDS